MAGYVIKVTIEDTHPPVWRRILIPDQINFYDLHKILQVCFAWRDVHLHAFTFAGAAGVEVGDGESGVYSEKSVQVDSLLKECSFIRYTYDFGDDWRHKIVLEQTDESYEKRYAVLLKVKGDSFVEDSGGVWGNERLTCSAVAISDDLEMLKCKIQKVTKQTQEVLDEVESAHAYGQYRKMGRNKIMAMLEQFVADMEKAAPVQETMQTQDALDSKSNEIYHFLDEWQEWKQAHPEEAVKPRKADNGYTQLTLLDSNIPIGTYLGKPAYYIEKKSTDVTIESVLMQGHATRLTDYCRYLGLQQDGTQMEQTQRIVAEFTRDPKCLFYIFSKEEFKELVAFFKEPDGIVRQEYSADTLTKALIMGLVDVEVRRNGLLISVGDYAKEMINRMDSFRYDSIYREQAKIDSNLDVLLMYYSMVEIDALYELYSSMWKNFGDLTEFKRYVYWHGRMTQRYITSTYTGNGKAYVMREDCDFEKIQEDTQKYAANIAYAPCNTKALKTIKKGIGEAFPAWNDMFEFLYLSQEIQDDEEYEKLAATLYEMTTDGESINAMLDVMEDARPSLGRYDDVTRYELVMHICMETPLPMLKGYTRMEFEQKFGASAFDMGLLEQQSLKTKVLTNTHLWEIPAEIQQCVWQALTTETYDGVKPLETAADALKCYNEELCYLLAVHYELLGQYDMARKNVHRIKGWEQDAVLMELVNIIGKDEKHPNQSYDWEDEYATIQPYRREQPKVGRNDPCPCGSGKKYKNCCGK